MVTPENNNADLERLLCAFEKIERREEIRPYAAEISKGTAVMSPREAILSETEIVSVDNASGRVCASPSVSCPPAVPIAISGEVIGEGEIAHFKKYGIEKIEVVKL